MEEQEDQTGFSSAWINQMKSKAEQESLDTELFEFLDYFMPLTHSKTGSQSSFTRSYQIIKALDVMPPSTYIGCLPHAVEN